jgi:hypothetical protein
MTDDVTGDDGADAPPAQSIYANETDDTYDLRHNHKQPNNNNNGLLPRERDQPDSWAEAVASLFAALAVVLCCMTGYKSYQIRQRRQEYQQVSELIV